MNTSITSNVNAAIKEDDGTTIVSTPSATLNPNPIIDTPTAPVETKEEPTYLRDDIARNRAEFFAGPEAMDTAIPSETSTTITATIPNNEVVILDETDAMDCSAVVYDTKPVDSSAGEPMDITSGEPPSQNSWTDDTEHAREVSNEEITATISATTQTRPPYCDGNYDPSGYYSDGDCP